MVVVEGSSSGHSIPITVEFFGDPGGSSKVTSTAYNPFKGHEIKPLIRWLVDREWSVMMSEQFYDLSSAVVAIRTNANN